LISPFQLEKVSYLHFSLLFLVFLLLHYPHLLPKSKQGHIYVLVMQYYFTKWPKAIPLKDTTAKSVAGVLLLVISTWGPPAELLSNQGLDFVVELNCKLLMQLGIKRQYAMAYHPQTNGQVEWFNRMLKTMIAKFVNGRQDN